MDVSDNVSDSETAQTAVRIPSRTSKKILTFPSALVVILIQKYLWRIASTFRAPTIGPS